MTEIRIDNTGEGTWWLYGYGEAWKDYVGCENFDEQVVLFGNRDCTSMTEASWYQRAKEILNDIDQYDEYPEDLSEEINEKLKSIYEKYNREEEIIFRFLKVLYPDDTFETGTIRGYCQGDWQNYIVKGNVNTDLFEAFYFGNVADITVNNREEEFGDVITHDELWKAEKEGLKTYLRKRYEIPENEEIKVLRADGMKQVYDWEEVNQGGNTMITRKEFEDTLWKMSYEEYEKCYCPDCAEKNCIHRDAYRRLPKIDGGLGLCPKLKESDQYIIKGRKWKTGDT